jgi:hypothetical protein
MGYHSLIFHIYKNIARDEYSMDVAAEKYGFDVAAQRSGFSRRAVRPRHRHGL